MSIPNAMSGRAGTRSIARALAWVIVACLIVSARAKAGDQSGIGGNSAGPVWRNSVDGFFSFVDQSTAGPGTQPPEGSAFAAGSPLSPMTPYDTFSSAPMTPGLAGIGQFVWITSYSGKKIKASLHASIGGVTGSITNVSYWTENLIPILNPHLGSQLRSQILLPYRVVFPTHAGQDDATELGLAADTLAVGSADDTWNFRAGYFDLNQTNRFVFAQPPLTNQTPEIAIAPAESLGNGPPALSVWPSAPVGLPLAGFDLTLHRESATAELTDATLPSLPGTSVRISNASIFLDRGQDTEFAAQVVHLTTGGAPISTTALFGAGGGTLVTHQGLLPFSTLGGQTATIAGFHAKFRMARALDASLDYGRNWYNATDVFRPGSNQPGNYWHGELAHPVGSSIASIGYYRWEPRYSTVILPYGVPENIWSVAWSWPGIWLKSNYQLADNTQLGANRQGFKVRLIHDGGTTEFHTSFAEFHQIDPSSYTLSDQVGFVEGFFLPQQPSFLTLGKEKQIGAWLGWHPQVFDVTLDFVDDMMHRDAAPGQPQDVVSYDAPQIVMTLSKTFKDKVVGALGFGHYAMTGSWANGPSTNVNYQQNVFFIGSQFVESAHTVALVQLRRAIFTGLPSIPNGPSPDFHGTLLVFEQRFHY